MTVMLTPCNKQLCCDSTVILKDCYWSECGSKGCPSNAALIATRLDKNNGGKCVTTGNPLSTYSPLSLSLTNIAMYSDV